MRNEKWEMRNRTFYVIWRNQQAGTPGKPLLYNSRGLHQFSCRGKSPAKPFCHRVLTLSQVKRSIEVIERKTQMEPMKTITKNDALALACDRAARRAGERFRQEQMTMYKASLQKKSEEAKKQTVESNKK